MERTEVMEPQRDGLDNHPAKAPETPASKPASVGLNAITPPSRKPAKPRRSLKAEGPDGAFTVTGQTAKALGALVAAGARGRTALEVATWAYRFGAYVHDLRHRHGLTIETVREPHGENGDWHGRYILRSRVRLLDREAGE